MLRLLVILLGFALVGCSPGAGSIAVQAQATSNSGLLESIPSPTPTRSIPVPEATQTALPDIASTVAAVNAPQILGTFRSPDASWQAQVLRHDCTFIDEYGDMAYEELRLNGTHGSYLADLQLINCGGLGGAGQAGMFWAPDSRYFYYTTAREGMPDGCIGYWKPPLSRIDVTNQSIQYLGVGEVSPDGSLIAVWQDAYLIIFPIETGDEVTIDLPLPGELLAGLAWSPSSDALIFIQAENLCPPSGSSVYLLKLADPLPTRLLGPQDPFIGEISWLDPARVQLVGGDGRIWTFDLAQGALVPPLP